MELTNKLVTTAKDWGLLRVAGIQGRNFVLTGAQSVPRQQMATLITGLGGGVQNSVSSTTNYLITPDGTQFRKGSKYRAAQERGVMILSEAEFCAMIWPDLDDLLS